MCFKLRADEIISHYDSYIHGDIICAGNLVLHANPFILMVSLHPNHIISGEINCGVCCDRPCAMLCHSSTTWRDWIMNTKLCDHPWCQVNLCTMISLFILQSHKCFHTLRCTVVPFIMYSLMVCANNRVHYDPMIVFVFFCTLHYFIIIIMQSYLKVLNF